MPCGPASQRPTPPPSSPFDQSFSCGKKSVGTVRIKPFSHSSCHSSIWRSLDSSFSFFIIHFFPLSNILTLPCHVVFTRTNGTQICESEACQGYNHEKNDNETKNLDGYEESTDKDEKQRRKYASWSKEDERCGEGRNEKASSCIDRRTSQEWNILSEIEINQ